MVVPTSVTIERIRGKIVLVSIQISASLNVPGIFTEPQSKKVMIRMITLQTIHAIKLHREFIRISWNEIFVGPKEDILFFIIFIKYIEIKTSSESYKTICQVKNRKRLYSNKIYYKSVWDSFYSIPNRSSKNKSKRNIKPFSIFFSYILFFISIIIKNSKNQNNSDDF